MYLSWAESGGGERGLKKRVIGGKQMRSSKAVRGVYVEGKGASGGKGMAEGWGGWKEDSIELGAEGRGKRKSA